jgi:alpha-galactosidase
LAVDPGAKLLMDNPDILLTDEDGAPRFMTWWDSYYMSPMDKKVIQHTKDMIKLFISDWDYDGLKMDGQHQNCVPPDYNWVRNIERPEDAGEQLPEFYKMVMETAKLYKKNVVIQNCPCGAVMSFYHLPYLNQTVASDPVGSKQIRSKGKTYKALAPNTAYYGDHVELSDSASDFASQFGVGAVLGTKFTYPKDNPFATEGSCVLTPEKEKLWKLWISLYNQKMLSRGDYLGELYDIGYDKPETHVIQKGDTLFYALYDSTWTGNVEIRGLKPGNYKMYDYVNKKDMGTISVSGNENPKTEMQFQRSLLFEVYPMK